MDQIVHLPNGPQRELMRRTGGGVPASGSLPYGDSPVDQENGADAVSGGLLYYWHLILRRKWTVLIIGFVGTLSGFLVSLPQTPVYRSRVSVEIQALNDNLMNTRQIDPTPGTNDMYVQTDILTQIKILQSDSLMERVVTKLKVDKKPGAFEQPTRLSAWRKALGLPQPATPSREQAAGMAAASVSVRSVNETRIVEILSDSTDPKFAADFANTLVNEYMEQSLESRWKNAQRTGDWLTRQLEDLRINLEKSEDKLQGYARSSGLMFTSEKDNVAEARLRQLQEELSKAQADRVAKQSRYEVALSSSLEALPEVLDDASLQDYRQKLTELRRQLAELGATYTSTHPKIERVDAQIASVQSALERERVNILKRIRNEQDAAARRESLLAAAYGTQAKLVSEQSGKTIHYGILRREVDTNRQLYDSMLQRVKEYGIASAMHASNMRVVDPAKPARLPYKPNLLQHAGVGFIAGLLLGTVFVVIQEQADRSLQSPGDGPTYLNLPELGVIPSAKADRGLNSYFKRLPALKGHKDSERTLGSALVKKNGGRNGNGNHEIELVTWYRKPSLLAESFRTTLASILFFEANGDRPRILVMTSSAPGEGKTTVTSNLAIALAEISRRVLVIDADMRRPRIHDIFDVANTWGLSDLLREKDAVADYPFEALSRKTLIPGLYVLPSGPGTVSISNLLYSPRLAELLNRFRKEFDTVLIDTPPMLQISDARVVGRLADGVILVLKAGQTTRDMALAATQRFAEDGTPVLGTILNQWNPNSTTGYGYYSDYHQYYSGERKSG
jgi:capsular exopolysaccharide synthesis family protein